MCQVSDKIVHSLMTSARERPYLTCGAAVAAAAIFCIAPIPADFIGEGFRYAVTFAADTNPTILISQFYDGAMGWLSTAGLGLEAKADILSLDISHQVRESINDMRIWIGPSADQASMAFTATIEKTVAFKSWVSSHASTKLAQGPAKIAADIMTGLAAISGAWEGLKLLRKSYEGIFGRKKNQSVAIDAQSRANVTDNLAMSGKNAPSFLAQSGLSRQIRLEHDVDDILPQSRSSQIDLSRLYPASRDVAELISEAGVKSDMAEDEIYLATSPRRNRIQPAGTSGVYMTRSDVDSRKIQDDIMFLAESVRESSEASKRKRPTVDLASLNTPSFH